MLHSMCGSLEMPGYGLSKKMIYRILFIYIFLMVLPKIAFGQHFFRIEGDISVKEKTEMQSQLTIGRFYYDKNIGKLVYAISFPEKQVVVSKDTVLYYFLGDTLASRTRSVDLTKFSIFYLTLSNKLSNYGLDNSFYKIDNVENDGGMVISTWVPGKRFSKHFGKVMLSSKENRLFGIIFYSPEGQIVGKQFFEDYKIINGIDFPTKMIKISYTGEQKTYQVTTFENIKLNNLNEKYYYDFPVPAY